MYELNRMVRGKVHLRKIQNPVNRRVTFSKRKGGLLKKAKELSTLCDAEIGLIIFSPAAKIYEFAKPSMSRIIGKYQKNFASTGDKLELSETIEEKMSLEHIRSLKMKAKSLIVENANLFKKEKSLIVENTNLVEKIGRSLTPCHLNIDIMEGVNDNLETDAATQQDLHQTNLNLTLS